MIKKSFIIITISMALFITFCSKTTKVKAEIISDVFVEGEYGLQVDGNGGDNYGEIWYGTGYNLPHAVDYTSSSLLSYVKRGDLVFEGKSGIMGLSGHSAVVEGIYFDSTYNQYFVRLIEAVSIGVVRSIMTPSRFASKEGEIYRLTNADSDDIDGAIDFMISQLGKDWDIKAYKSSSPSNDEWYCSELVWAAFLSQNINLDSDVGIVRPSEVRDYGDAQLIMHYDKTTIAENVNSTMHKTICDGEEMYGNHFYVWTNLNGNTHIKTCSCGATQGVNEVHTLDSSCTGRFKQCIYCKVMVDSSAGIFPILGIKKEEEVI